MVAFFVTICLCGLLIWAGRSIMVEPLLVSINRTSGQWSVINRSVSVPSEYSRQYMMQESVVGNFFQNWFLISDDANENDAVWRADCAAHECTGAETMAYDGHECALACGAGADLYKKFVSDVMPDYHLRATAGETWHVDVDTIQANPVIPDYENGGETWMVRATVISNVNYAFDVVAFVRLGRMANMYPMTMGYYVADFNAYRI